jgi:hypothetical protein
MKTLTTLKPRTPHPCAQERYIERAPPCSLAPPLRLPHPESLKKRRSSKGAGAGRHTRTVLAGPTAFSACASAGRDAGQRGTAYGEDPC